MIHPGVGRERLWMGSEDAPLAEVDNGRSTPLVKLGELIQFLRIQKNLGKQDVALETHCSIDLVSAVESGTANFEDVVSLLPPFAKVLNVRVSFLEKELARYAGLLDDD